MLSMIAALAVSAAAVPAVEYKFERLGSKEVLLEGATPLEPQQTAKFEHSSGPNSISMELTVRPTDADDHVAVELKFVERGEHGKHHAWQGTLVIVRGVATTSELSWGEGGWRIRLKVS